MIPSSRNRSCPGDGLAAQKMPGHWLLARLGKRVLRPGGIGLTRWLIGALAISDQDDVVELAPGLGVTAQLVLKRQPHSYTGVERDPAAAAQVAGVLNMPPGKVRGRSRGEHAVCQTAARRWCWPRRCSPCNRICKSCESWPRSIACSNRKDATPSTSCASFPTICRDQTVTP